MLKNRCPCCIDGNEFKLMAQSLEGSRIVFFLCKKCGHIATQRRDVHVLVREVL